MQLTAPATMTGIALVASAVAAMPATSQTADAPAPAVQLTSGEGMFEGFHSQYLDFSDATLNGDAGFEGGGDTNLAQLVAASTEALNTIFERAVNGSSNMPLDVSENFLQGLLGANPDAVDSVSGTAELPLASEYDAIFNGVGGGLYNFDDQLGTLGVLPSDIDVDDASELHDLVADTPDNVFDIDNVGGLDDAFDEALIDLADPSDHLDPSDFFG